MNETETLSLSTIAGTNDGGDDGSTINNNSDIMDSSYSYSSRYSLNQQKVLVYGPKPLALLSMVCSLILITWLLRGNTQNKHMKKIYGRLWLFISLGNFGIAFMSFLSTVTMPSTSYDADDGDDSPAMWYGAYGTMTSCKISASIFHYIFVATMVYKGSLGLYYHCCIHASTQWNECMVKQKRVDYIIHFVALVYPAIGICVGWMYDMYGPSDMFAYCWVAPTPFGCRGGDQDDDSSSCSSGNHKLGRPFFILLSSLIELNPFTFFKLMAVFTIYFTLSKQQRMMKLKYHSDGNNSLATETLIQAALFLVAGCLIPYTFSIFLRLIDMFFWKHVKYPASDSFFIFALFAHVFFPLQGVFNLVIFFRPKLKQRQIEVPDETLWESIWSVLFYRPRPIVSRHNNHSTGTGTSSVTFDTTTGATKNSKSAPVSSTSRTEGDSMTNCNYDASFSASQFEEVADDTTSRHLEEMDDLEAGARVAAAKTEKEKQQFLDRRFSRMQSRRRTTTFEEKDFVMELMKRSQRDLFLITRKNETSCLIPGESLPGDLVEVFKQIRKKEKKQESKRKIMMKKKSSKKNELEQQEQEKDMQAERRNNEDRARIDEEDGEEDEDEDNANPSTPKLQQQSNKLEASQVKGGNASIVSMSDQIQEKAARESNGSTPPLPPPPPPPLMSPESPHSLPPPPQAPSKEQKPICPHTDPIGRGRKKPKRYW